MPQWGGGAVNNGDANTKTTEETTAEAADTTAAEDTTAEAEPSPPAS